MADFYSEWEAGYDTLLNETVKTLEANGKSPKDVVWCGSEDLGWFTWDDFALAADFFYERGYGGTEVHEDLLVVGEDFWLERHDYDGAEWWEFKKLPIKPSKQTTPHTLRVFEEEI